nr:MAG TPA: hypothetical protein [Caudoviricetes sp.]
MAEKSALRLSGIQDVGQWRCVEFVLGGIARELKGENQK